MSINPYDGSFDPKPFEIDTNELEKRIIHNTIVEIVNRLSQDPSLEQQRHLESIKNARNEWNKHNTNWYRLYLDLKDYIINLMDEYWNSEIYNALDKIRIKMNTVIAKED